MDRQSNLQPGLPMDGAVKDLGQEMRKNITWMRKLDLRISLQNGGRSRT